MAKKRITTYDVRLVKEESKLYELDSTQINSTYDAGNIIQTVCHLYDSAVEKFGLICLDAKHKIIGIHILHVGGLSTCTVEIRSIYQRALLNNAHSIIIFHNHPSGDPEPSQEDKDITRRIVEAGKIMMVEVLDHVICGDVGRYVSLAERGII